MDHLDPKAGITEEDIEKKPWKYIGYHGYSSFISSDNDFFFLRRFGSLHARVLLALQDEIAVCEERLHAIDYEYSRKEVQDIHNGSFRQDEVHERSDLVCSIRKKLKEYDELALAHAQLRAQVPVPARNIQSVSNWLYNKVNAISEPETTYLNHSADLFTMVPKSKSALRCLLERSQNFRLSSLWRTRSTETALTKSDIGSEEIYYSSDKSIDQFVAAIILFLGVAMLIAPLWILQFVQGSVHRLGIITVFIVLFLILLSGTTVAKPFESLAGAAAYSAVLMVFLQNSG